MLWVFMFCSNRNSCAVEHSHLFKDDLVPDGFENVFSVMVETVDQQIILLVESKIVLFLF